MLLLTTLLYVGLKSMAVTFFCEVFVAQLKMEVYMDTNLLNNCESTEQIHDNDNELLSKYYLTTTTR